MGKRKTKTQPNQQKRYPDHSKQLPRLNRIEGQIVGIKRMVEERRYCPDVIQQIRATRKALLAIEVALLEKHLYECVTEAIESRSEGARNEKLVEIVRIFRNAEEKGIDF